MGSKSRKRERSISKHASSSSASSANPLKSPALFAAAELDLHGLTVMEMLPALDEFLHNSYRAGCNRVRIVHGKGTGMLKLEVGRRLADHPLVTSYWPADSFHGGSGATEVQLSYY
jgi:DNA-nicking Smr family endonuclease